MHRKLAKTPPLGWAVFNRQICMNRPTRHTAHNMYTELQPKAVAVIRNFLKPLAVFSTWKTILSRH